VNRTRSHATIGLLIAAGADRRFLADALRQAGNGVAILDAARAPDDLDIDLVIVDEAWIRGEFDALVGWKTAQRPHYLPFLALLPQRSNTRGLLRVGFDDVLRSPIANDELLARVETFLRLRRHAQETHASNEARFRATLDRMPTGVSSA
jgi:DNA-binding response OmpR family regulator